jgi:hypothetical protein
MFFWTDARLNVLQYRPRVEVHQMVATTEMSTHRPGRRTKLIDPDLLREALHCSRGIGIRQLARSLKVHHSTVYKNMKAHKISHEFSNVSSSELDHIIVQYKKQKPGSGLRFVTAHLRAQGLRIQRELVEESINRVDKLGTQLRKKQTVKRRVYFVPRPNHLWHMDGHHKLIRWGIVIHGIIDGFCRTVSSKSPMCSRYLTEYFQITGLKAGDNNRASSVFELYMDAIENFGCPSRCRGDRGGENVSVALYMIMARGPGRASYMWGS